MASMNKKERAEHYLRRLNSAKNKRAEAQQILEELNSLVWANSQQPLKKSDRLEIIEELEKAFYNRRKISNESLDSTTASDNSGIIDVISALKRGTKD